MGCRTADVEELLTVLVGPVLYVLFLDVKFTDVLFECFGSGLIFLLGGEKVR